MRRLIYSLSFFVLIALLPRTALLQERKSIDVGALLALSGTAARYGLWAQRGIQIAVDEINATGGVHGQSIRIRFEDDQSSPAKAVSSYQKLRAVENVSFFLTMQSSVSLTIAEYANRDQVVQMDTTATTPQYSSPNDFTFRSGVRADQLTTELASLIYDRSGIKKLACLYLENDYGEGMYHAFQKEYQGEIALAESFVEGVADYRSQLLRIKQQGIENVWIIGHLREVGTIIRQAYEMGLSFHFYSDVFSIEGPDFFTAAGPAVSNIQYVAPGFDANADISAVKRLTTAYNKRYKQEPTYLVAQAYDGMNALAEAMRACEDLQPVCVKNNLYRVDFAGASGQIHFDKNGDTDKVLVVKNILNGEIHPG